MAVLRLTPGEKAIFEALRAREGRFVSTPELCEMFYRGAIWPLNPAGVIRQMIFRLRRKLAGRAVIDSNKSGRGVVPKTSIGYRITLVSRVSLGKAR